MAYVINRGFPVLWYAFTCGCTASIICAISNNESSVNSGSLSSFFHSLKDKHLKERICKILKACVDVSH